MTPRILCVDRQWRGPAALKDGRHGPGGGLSAGRALRSIHQLRRLSLPRRASYMPWVGRCSQPPLSVWSPWLQKVRASGKHQEVREARDQWSHDKPAFLAASPTTPADDPLAEAKKAVQNLNVDLGRNIKRLSDKLQAPDSKVPVEDVMDFLKIINTKFSVNTSSVRAKLSRARPKAGLTGDDVAQHGGQPG